MGKGGGNAGGDQWRARQPGAGSRVHLLYGYLASSVLMLAAALVEALYGVKAEKQGLENLAAPLSAEECA